MIQHIAYYHSPLKVLRIQCSDEHITDVSFVNNEVPIVSDDHPLLQSCIGQLDEYFNGNLHKFDLPLKQAGSSFQQQAWQLLNEVPYGKTISYLTMAKRYGDVKAIRALASANGKNKLAIVVPCHRVIGSNQSLTGYAGGLWRKQWLLEHEAKWSGSAEQLGMF